MKLISRFDTDTGDTLVWCGDSFNPIETQKALFASGLSLKEIRDDKWAVVESSSKITDEESENGQEQEG